MSLTFAERVALAKKQKEEADANRMGHLPTPTETTTSTTAPTPTIQDKAKEEEPPTTPATPMSFAEKLKLRAAQAKLATKIEKVEDPDNEEVEKVVESAEPLPRVILLANEANKLGEVTEGELLAKEVPDNVLVLKRKIASLQDMEGVSLRSEMDDLRTLLKSNPDACLYFLPEDTGLLVRALRRITDNKVAADMGSARTSKKQAAGNSKPLTAEELRAALDDL